MKPEEGSNLYVDMCIPKDAVKKEGAGKFINFIKPENMAPEYQWISYSTAESSRESLPRDKTTKICIRRDQPTSETFTNPESALYDELWTLIRA